MYSFTLKTDSDEVTNFLVDSIDKYDIDFFKISKKKTGLYVAILYGRK